MRKGKKMARTSIQYELVQNAIIGITDMHTVKAYKKDCKLFAVYCREHGAKKIEDVKNNPVLFLQQYEKQLERCGYTPATIHRRLAAPCKGLGICMAEIKKPRRMSGQIIRSRGNKNLQGEREEEKKRYARVVKLQRSIGLRRSELARLTGKDLCKDESGYWAVHVVRGKGGKEQWQRILPENVEQVRQVFADLESGQKVFSSKEMNNKIDLHRMRRECAQKAYEYYLHRIRAEPEYAKQAKIELIKRYICCNKNVTKEKAIQWLFQNIRQGQPYLVRGDNREKALAQNKPVQYDRLALLMVSVFHLSHWRLDVTITNYII